MTGHAPRPGSIRLREPIGRPRHAARGEGRRLSQQRARACRPAQLTAAAAAAAATATAAATAATTTTTATAAITAAAAAAAAAAVGGRPRARHVARGRVKVAGVCGVEC